MKTKNFKTYLSFLAIVNHRNWLDGLSHLNIFKTILLQRQFIAQYCRITDERETESMVNEAYHQTQSDDTSVVGTATGMPFCHISFTI